MKSLILVLSPSAILCKPVDISRMWPFGASGEGPSRGSRGSPGGGRPERAVRRGPGGLRPPGLVGRGPLMGDAAVVGGQEGPGRGVHQFATDCDEVRAWGIGTIAARADADSLGAGALWQAGGVDRRLRQKKQHYESMVSPTDAPSFRLSSRVRLIATTYMASLRPPRTLADRTGHYTGAVLLR